MRGQLFLSSESAGRLCGRNLKRHLSLDWAGAWIGRRQGWGGAWFVADHSCSRRKKGKGLETVLQEILRGKC